MNRRTQEKLDQGDGSALVKITGCEYKINTENILNNNYKDHLDPG